MTLSDRLSLKVAGLQYALIRDGDVIASGPRRTILAALTNEGPVLSPSKMAEIEALPEVPGF
jgi:hypothetical protein